MKTYRSQRGPFQERPYFEQDEIEALCQEELRKVSLLPSGPGPIRIERFIEKRFGVTPLYEELPPGVLGFTRFTTKGVEAIVISRSLADEENKASARRINSTLAHEAGHGLLHTYLFAVGSQPERLFGDEYDSKVPKILCRDETANNAQKPRYDGRWWEFQANQTIGALLLPKAWPKKPSPPLFWNPPALLDFSKSNLGIGEGRLKCSPGRSTSIRLSRKYAWNSYFRSARAPR